MPLPFNNPSAVTTTALERRMAIGTAVAVTATVLVVYKTPWAQQQLGRLKRTVLRRASQLASVSGFATHTVWDVASHGFSAKTMQWDKALRLMEKFLRESGIDKEINGALSRPRFLDIVALLCKIHSQELLLDNNPSVVSTVTADSCTDVPTMEEAARIMRFATAVYGHSMISSVEFELEPDLPSVYTTEEAVLRHTGIATADDLWIKDSLEYGSGEDSLRYLVAVDHAHKALVFAIRGTFDLSGTVVDLVAFTEPFCGGHAHAGMADMARKLLQQKALSEVAEKAKGLPDDYELVVCGHSLGGGVACLVTMLFLHEGLLPPNVKLRCLAFAPPPVYAPLDSEAARMSMKRITAYVYARDVVPHLSIHAFRVLFAQVAALDQACQNKTWWEMWQIQQVPPELVDPVLQARSAPLRAVDGAPLLAIPAARIVWLGELVTDEQEMSSESTRSPVICDPVSFAKNGIVVHPNMMDDHMTPMYQMALETKAFFKRTKQVKKDW